MTKSASYQRAFYDRHYAARERVLEDQLAHPLLRGFFDRLAERVLDAAPAGRDVVRVAELGCGEGLLAAALVRVAARRGVLLSYTGSDVSDAAVRVAQRVAPGRYLVGDAQLVASQLEGGSADVVICKNLLHHLPRPQTFLAEVPRVLAPGGRFVAAEAALGSPQAWIFNVLAPVRERYFFVSVRRRTRRAFERAGLRVVHVGPFSFLPYELLFVIRYGFFRRRLAPSDPATVRRVDDADERWSRRLGALAAYTLWVAEPAGLL
jgi:SAM-dependent methyltransferase